jgi:propionate CoA-transferase
MRLTPDGWIVTEVAPGIDVQRDIIQQMAFQPLISSALAVMAVDLSEA